MALARAVDDDRAAGASPGGEEGHGLPEATDALRCGPLWISPDEMCEVRVHGRPVHMSVQRQRILAQLIRAHGRVVGREEIYSLATGRVLPRASRAVDVHMARIRQSLGPLGRHVVAVPGRGYRLDIAALERLR